MFDISFQHINDTPELADRWRALENVSEGGFFRGWSYLATLLPHFAAPRLLAVRQDGQDIALGLFNASKTWRGTSLILHEAGAQPFDGLYVEHNGLLLRSGAQACLPAALAVAARCGTVVLSGIDTPHLEASRRAGRVVARKTSRAPAIDLTALRGAGRPYLDTLSANARAQIRRAMRLYGPDLAITPAGNVAEALSFLERLVQLHQASWAARGQPGAFAMPAIRSFHARLIQTAWPRGEVALLRVAAGAREVGFLYQFQHGRAVLNYQAGLAAEADARFKPGLVCHALAIELALAAGAARYDFLAGAQRYKDSLVPRGADGGQALHWATLYRAGSPRGLLASLTAKQPGEPPLNPVTRQRAAHDGA